MQKQQKMLSYKLLFLQQGKVYSGCKKSSGTTDIKKYI